MRTTMATTMTMTGRAMSTELVETNSVEETMAFAKAQAFNCYLCATVHVAHAHRMRGRRWADDPAAIAEMIRKAPQAVGDCFDLIEREMIEGPWVLGEAYSVCDMYLGTLAQWLEVDGVDVARLPKVVDHRRRMSENPVVRRVLADEQAAAD